MRRGLGPLRQSGTLRATGNCREWWLSGRHGGPQPGQLHRRVLPGCLDVASSATPGRGWIGRSRGEQRPGQAILRSAEPQFRTGAPNLSATDGTSRRQLTIGPTALRSNPRRAGAVQENRPRPSAGGGALVVRSVRDLPARVNRLVAQGFRGSVLIILGSWVRAPPSPLPGLSGTARRTDGMDLP
jgi:hypothetical protein